MKSLGRNGTLTAEDATNTDNDFFTVPTYWPMWKTMYPHLKVSCLLIGTAFYLYPATSQQCSSQQQPAAAAAAAAGDNAGG
jgi:hypothetical protein